MFDWIRRKIAHMSSAHEDMPHTAPADVPETAADSVPGPLSAEAFDALPEYLRKEYLHTESLISREQFGLDLDFLYIGDDGHAEFAYFDCDLTPPSMFKEVFDFTFRPEEAEKLCLALGIGKDIFEQGGTERFVRMFRALMPYVSPRYDSLELREEFPALLREHGIRTEDPHSGDPELWKGSPFLSARLDAGSAVPKDLRH